MFICTCVNTNTFSCVNILFFVFVKNTLNIFVNQKLQAVKKKPIHRGQIKLWCLGFSAVNGTLVSSGAFVGDFSSGWEWRRRFRPGVWGLGFRLAGPPNHHDDKVDSDQ